LQQDGQYLKGLFLQPDTLALFAQFSRPQVRFKDSKAQDSRRLRFQGHGELPVLKGV
jgi:hypothetical protein